MVSLVVGENGKGKTQFLIDMANTAMKTADGHIVYIDKSNKHMYELDRKIRLVDISRYPLNSGSEFIGFICGMAAQNHDIEKIYIDSFLKITKVADDTTVIKAYIEELEEIGRICNVDFIISISKSKDELDPDVQEKVAFSL